MKPEVIGDVGVVAARLIVSLLIQQLQQLLSHVMNDDILFKVRILDNCTSMAVYKFQVAKSSNYY